MWDSPRRFSPSQLSSFVLCLLFQLQFYLYTLATHAVAAYPPQSYQLIKIYFFILGRFVVLFILLKTLWRIVQAFVISFRSAFAHCTPVFMGAKEKILWSNFLVTDFFLLLYFFFLIGNPSLPQKLNDFLLLGKIFKLPSCSNQFSSNLINTSSRERGLTSGFSVFLFRSSYLENLEEF